MNVCYRGQSGKRRGRHLKSVYEPNATFASRSMSPFPTPFLRASLSRYPPLLAYLFDLGRQAGGAWIAEHGDALGQRSTIDLDRLLPVNADVWGHF